MVFRKKFILKKLRIINLSYFFDPKGPKIDPFSGILGIGEDGETWRGAGSSGGIVTRTPGRCNTFKSIPYDKSVITRQRTLETVQQ